MGENFLDAVSEGRRAALDADHNRAEIQSVIDALDAQIRQLSKGKVRVERAPRPEQPVLTRMPDGRLERALLLVSEGQRRRLCEFEEGPRGYPVEIRYPGVIESVMDRESLVKALHDVLSTPAAGRFFNELLGPPESAPSEPT